MKKLLKPVMLTIIVLAALTVGAFMYLKKDGGSIDDFANRRIDDQSDMSADNKAYRLEIDKKAIELTREGSEEEKNVLNFDSDKNPYSLKTTKSARERIERLIRRTDATFDKPLIAANPFGTNPNSYYFYFTTGYRCMVRYTVTVAQSDIPDHVRYVNNGNEDNMATTHEFTIGGLVPGMMNYIIVELLDSTGSHREDITYKVMVPLLSVPARLLFDEGRSDKSLTSGLFFLLPKDDKRIIAYDNSGILRNITSTESGHGKRIYQSGARLIYQVSDKKIARVTGLGEVDGVAKLPSGYGSIMDFSYDGYENAIVLSAGEKVTQKKAKKKGKKTIKSVKRGRYELISLSLDTGKSQTLYTFPKGITPYSLSAPLSGDIYVSVTKPAGLMHIKALTSTRPRVTFILGDKKAWKKTKLKKKVAKYKKPKDPDSKIQDFTGWSLSGSLPELIIDESDTKTDRIAMYVFDKGKGTGLKFAVDTKNKTATSEVKIPIARGGANIMQTYDGHSLLAGLVSGDFEEYDDDNQITRQFTFGKRLDGIWKLSLKDMCFYL